MTQLKEWGKISTEMWRRINLLLRNLMDLNPNEWKMDHAFIISRTCSLWYGNVFSRVCLSTIRLFVTEFGISLFAA